MKITVKVKGNKKAGRKATSHEINLGYTLTINQALQRLDEASLIEQALAPEIEEATALCATLLRKGKTASEIETVLADWKPGFELPKPVVGKAGNIVKVYQSLTDEERAAVLKELGLA